MEPFRNVKSSSSKRYVLILGCVIFMGLINKVDVVCLSPVGYGV